MTHKLSVLAVDLGAESGRVIEAAFDGERITMHEHHRFSNTPVETRGTLHWDVLRLWHNIRLGVDAGRKQARSVGVDTWGVDVALLDREGMLLGNPLHYRDASHNGMVEYATRRVPRRAMFEATGIQFMQINGLYGLVALAQRHSPLLELAGSLLTIPDLFNYWLSGSRTCEYTHATTTQLYDPRQQDWARDMLHGLDIPTHFLTPVVFPGDRIGDYDGLEVIVPATHDTASAVVGIPTTTRNYAYLSSGTWSLLGVEVDAPIINDAAYEANLTNEGGAYGTIRLLKNVMGLWLAQQCRETWLKQGHDYAHSDLVALAAHAVPFVSLIDPDDPDFLAHGDMPSRIRAWCQRTAQPLPEAVGQIMRTVYESLALKYRYVVELLRRVSGQSIDRLHIIGGGSQNALLCQMTANALGIPVVAGPAEATALGNALVQFITHGALANLGEAREMLSRTISTVTYDPQDGAQWDAQYQRFQHLMKVVTS